MVFFWGDRTKQDPIDLYIKQIGNESRRRLTSHRRQDGWGSDSAWSPDGLSIAHAHYGDKAAIILVPANGGRERQVAEFEDVLGISPRMKARVSPPLTEGDELWKVPVGGGEETRVLKGIIGGQVDIGRRGIYFLSRPDQGTAASPGDNESRFLFHFLSLCRRENNEDC